jgi:hypothetical protein
MDPPLIGLAQKNSRVGPPTPGLVPCNISRFPQNIRINQQIAVISAPVRDFYLVRFWSPRRSGVTLANNPQSRSSIQVAGIPLKVQT